MRATRQNYIDGHSTTQARGDSRPPPAVGGDALRVSVGMEERSFEDDTYED